MNTESDHLVTSTVDWYTVLPRLGAAPELIQNPRRLGPCPIEGGGKTRFRFDNKDGRGTWICNHCGSGDGVELIARINGWDNREAFIRLANEVRGRTGHEPISPRTYKVRPLAKTTKDIEKARNSLKRTWEKAVPIDGTPAATYLLSRIPGLNLAWLAPSFRHHPGLYHFDEETAKKGVHPALLARVVDAADPLAVITIHRTYLDGHGHKAPVSPGQVKKVMTATVDKIRGESIRLNTAIGTTVIVSEGIENGLALVAATGNSVPVFAALNCGNLGNFKWPKATGKIVIAADHDPVNPKTGLRPGIHHAMLLRQRAWDAGVQAVIKIPPVEGVDWDDMWLQGECLLPAKRPASLDPHLQEA